MSYSLNRSSLRQLIIESVDMMLPRCHVSEIEINSIPILVEIADTDFLRNRGLMFRQHMPENSGMLFVFPGSDNRGFWMKNTLIPLSIAFINEGGHIINIENMEPNDLNSRYSSGPARYALEMNRGWFDKNSVRPGCKVFRI